MNAWHCVHFLNKNNTIICTKDMRCYKIRDTPDQYDIPNGCTNIAICFRTKYTTNECQYCSTGPSIEDIMRGMITEVTLHMNSS